MEQLKAELSAALGEPVGRMVQISEQPYARLYALYTRQGAAIPLVAKSYLCGGVAQQEAYKLSMLARQGTVRLPAVFGVLMTQQSPFQEVLLMERLSGVAAEAPARTPARWESLKEQIVEGLLSWHRIDSHGCVGNVDSVQENGWAEWYQQRVTVIGSLLDAAHMGPLAMPVRRALVRSQAQLTTLFADFDDGAVLVHGNLTLRSVLKESRSDQLLAMLNPGMILWAPREYDLFRLCEDDMSADLLGSYLRKAPVSEAFMARRWLYMLWEAANRYLHTGVQEQAVLARAAQQLLPWLG
ncbi:MAG: YcbJ family phosphotransferase [Edwardsiella sp. (in: enterobacteria)]